MIILYEKILGRTGLKVKTYGFGGIPIQRLSEEEAINVVRRCYELGVNYYARAQYAKEKFDGCIHCGECESRCPYELPIQELLPRAMQSLWDHMENQTIPN